jgi:hypothetical protein
MEVLRENLPQRHFVHQKSHMTRPGSEPGRRGGKSPTNRPSYGAAWGLGLMLTYKMLSNVHSTPYVSQRSDDSTSSCNFNINFNNVAHIITSTILLWVQRMHVKLARSHPLELQAHRCSQPAEVTARNFLTTAHYCAETNCSAIHRKHGIRRVQCSCEKRTTSRGQLHSVTYLDMLVTVATVYNAWTVVTYANTRVPRYIPLTDTDACSCSQIRTTKER